MVNVFLIFIHNHALWFPISYSFCLYTFLRFRVLHFRPNISGDHSVYIHLPSRFMITEYTNETSNRFNKRLIQTKNRHPVDVSLLFASM